MHERSSRAAIGNKALFFRKEPGRRMKATLKIKPDAKILLIRVLGIGEGVMFGPVMKHMRRSYPDADIQIMTGTLQAGFFAGSGLVDRTIAVDEKKIVSKNIPYMLRLLWRLRRESYDLVISSHPHIFYSIIARLIGAKQSIGFNWNGRGRFYRTRIGASRLRRPKQYFRLLEPLGIDGDVAVVPFFTPADLEKARALMSELDGASGTLVGFCPGGAQNPGVNFLQKRWPRERYVELAGFLQKHNVKIVVFGGPSDNEEGAELTERFGGIVVDLTGKLTLAETQAAMSRCDVIVAHDSGPLHLAVASGTHVIGIYGATMSEMFYEPSELTIVRNDVDCGPCCPEYPDEYPFRIPQECDTGLVCMKGISAEMIFEKVKPFLTSRTEQNVEI